MDRAISYTLSTVLLTFPVGCARETPADRISNTSGRPLSPCAKEGVSEPLLCGRLTVPENRALRSGRTIQLEVVVVPSKGDSAKADPVFLIDGGPGGAITQAAAGMARFLPARDRDWVLVDQRGTGGSNSLGCDELDAPADIVMPRFHLSAVEKCRSELSQRADLTQYSTLAAIQDLDSVRAWLGYDSINLVGSSYGTRPILEYLRRYGSRVRTAMLLGPVPPDFRRPLFYGRDGLRVLSKLFALCEADSACQRAYPNLQRKLEQVVLSLQRAPAGVTWRNPESGTGQTFRLDASTFSEILWVYVSGHDKWRIPHLITRAAVGDFAPFLENAFPGGQLNVRDAPEGMYLSITCAEETMRIRDEDVNPTTPVFFASTRLSRQRAACRAWPLSTLPADFFEPVHTDAQVMIITGDLDSVTGLNWAAPVAAIMPSSRLIEIRGLGHSAGPGSIADCMRSMHLSLLQQGNVAAVDTTCVATAKPPGFFVSTR